MPSPRRKPSVTAVQNPLETYLRDINETALLTADDEKRLARAIAQGDALARDHMVRANLRLVVNIARGYANRGLLLPDLIEEGNLGLLRAVEGFDPTMGTRFSTYASYWIKQSIKRALINSGKTIRIPAYMVEILSKWRRATARLNDTLGRPPTPEEVARSLGLARKKLPIIKKAIDVNHSSPHVDSAEGGWSLGELIRDENARCPADVMIDQDTLRHVLTRIDQLAPPGRVLRAGEERHADQYQPPDPIRPRRGDLRCEQRAGVVAQDVDRPRRRGVDRVDRLCHGRGIGLEGNPFRRAVRAAVAGRVDRDHGEALGQRGDQRQQRRRGARRLVP